MRVKHRLQHNLLIAVLLLSVLSACDKGHARRQRLQFTDEVRLGMTPVKDQGESQLCWVYAMLATIESERLEQGDSVNLSPDFLARHWTRQLARMAFLSGVEANVSLSGTLPMALHLLQTEGAMPYDAYHAREANYNALCRRLTLAADNTPTLDALERATDDALDEVVGSLPQHVYMFGATYTPLEFAHSVCRRDDYEALTSFSHHPFGKPFVLEMPDNRMVDAFQNVPIDTLMARIDHSLRLRHAVAWEGDTSEPGFLFAAGTADLKRPRQCTQEERQRAFASCETTDDHCMALIGIAHDSEGRRWYIAKNSWGTDNPYGGLMYISADYLRMKTIAVVIKRL